MGQYCVLYNQSIWNKGYIDMGTSLRQDYYTLLAYNKNQKYTFLC